MKSNRYYKYSNQEVRFVEVYKSETDKYLKNYPLFLAGIICSLMLVAAFSYFVPTPREYNLLKQNRELHNAFQELGKEVQKLEHTFEILSNKDDSLYRMILGADPVPSTVRQAGIGGTPSKKLKIAPELGALPHAINDQISELLPKTSVLNYSFDETMKLAHKNVERLKYIPAIMPVYNENLERIGAGYGMRMHPVLGIRRLHEGLDFYAVTGTSVFATANGFVKSNHFSKTFGKLIILDHGNGLETLYAHLSEFKVKKGDKVRRGDIIGLVGASGLVSGPHLHYEVHLNGQEQDPLKYLISGLSPEQYQKVIELSQRDVYSMD